MKQSTFTICQECYNIFSGTGLSCPDCSCRRLLPLGQPGFIYEVGDHVVLKTGKEMTGTLPGPAAEGLKLDYDELDPGYDPEMEAFAGKETFITKVYVKEGWVELDIDKGRWSWSPLWMKPLEHNTVTELKSCLKDDLFEL